MSIDKKDEDLREKIQIALDRAIKKVIADAKVRDSYLVIADKDGKVVKIPAKDL